MVVKKSQRHRSGWTLMELLVVIMLVMLLMSIVTIVIFSAQERARQTQCMSNLRQLITAFSLYVSDYQLRPERNRPSWTALMSYIKDNRVFTVS